MNTIGDLLAAKGIYYINGKFGNGLRTPREYKAMFADEIDGTGFDSDLPSFNDLCNFLNRVSPPRRCFMLSTPTLKVTARTLKHLDNSMQRRRRRPNKNRHKALGVLGKAVLLGTKTK